MATLRLQIPGAETIAPALAHLCTERAETAQKAMGAGQNADPSTRPHVAALRDLAEHVRKRRTPQDQQMLALGRIARAFGGIQPYALGPNQARLLSVIAKDAPAPDPAEIVNELLDAGVADLVDLASAEKGELTRERDQAQKDADRTEQAEQRAQEADQAARELRERLEAAETEIADLAKQRDYLREQIDTAASIPTAADDPAADGPPDRRPHPDAEGVNVVHRKTLGERFEIEWSEPGEDGGTKRRREVGPADESLEEAVARRAAAIAHLDADQ